MKNRLLSNQTSFTNNKIEVNSSCMLYDLIKDKDITIITENYQIDTTKLGVQNIPIEIIQNKTKKKISLKIDIIDSQKPTIKAQEEIIVNIGENIDLLENVLATDNSKEELKISIKGEYNLNKEGEYKLEYYTTDSSNNISTKKFTLKVISLPQAPTNYTEYKNSQEGEYTTSTGHTITIKNGITIVEQYLIVNKTYSLPNTYKPINPYSSTTTDSCLNCIEKETMEAFKIMSADAKAIGLNIYISSGYRSYDYQKNLYNNYVTRDGKINADKYSARPGHSEHQSGLCFDLNSIDDSFAKTEEGKWINNNAYLYGFIIRYPQGKEDITGYQYESWHLRYVGKDLAQKLYNNGKWITMEEYFGLTSSYN